MGTPVVLLRGCFMKKNRIHAFHDEFWPHWNVYKKILKNKKVITIFFRSPNFFSIPRLFFFGEWSNLRDFGSDMSRISELLTSLESSSLLDPSKSRAQTTSVQQQWSRLHIRLAKINYLPDGRTEDGEGRRTTGFDVQLGWKERFAQKCKTIVKFGKNP